MASSASSWVALILLVCLILTTEARKKGHSHSHSSKRGYSPAYPPTPIYKPIPTTGKVLNPIDSCWRRNPNWATNRQSLAECVVGYGQGTLGGSNGDIYVVTSPDDDAVNPKPGTLRYGVVQPQPLWIIFDRDMSITLDNELIINSYKTIDGRGAKVEIANGPCLTIQGVTHVIVHGISLHNCKPGKSGLVMSTTTHVGHRQGSDGDGISIFASSYVWVDHCFFAQCFDGLIDIIHASTAITISNNYFTQHDKVMLLGHQDGYTADKLMKVTIAFNHFATDCVQRMPRVRYGFAHVANNKYDEWGMYAVGGSADPTIYSEGNYYIAPNSDPSKQVTKRESSGWSTWKWRSSRDVFVNGAYFVQSGYGMCDPLYSSSQRFSVAAGTMVPALTADAGPLSCSYRRLC